MSEQTIDKLQIEIEAQSGASVGNIDKLAASLDRLKSVTASGNGNLSRISASLNELKSVSEGLRSKTSVITSLAKSLNSLNGIKINSSGLSELGNIPRAFEGIGSTMSDMKDFSKGVTAMNTGFKKLEQMDLDSVANRVTQLVTAIKPLTNEMVRGGQGVSNYGTQMKELASAMKITNSIANTTKSSSARGIAYSGWQSINFMGLASKVAIAATAIKRATNMVGGFVTNINSYIESVNLFTVAMGDAADSGAEFAQNMQDILGIDAGEAMKNMGLFSQLTTSFGVASNQAEVLSKNLTQLGYDISSFFNLSIDESFTKLQSGIAGEIEPLRRIGIDLSEARLKAELFSLGINATYESLTQADKSLLRYIAIMKQTTNVQGDMARTILTPANAMRVLSAQTTVAARAIGSIFIPALTRILPYAIAVIRVIGEMASSLASFLGFEMPTIDYSSVGNLSTEFETATDNANDLTDSIKNTKKEISGLLGFDEINALSSTTTSTASASTSTENPTDLLSGIELPSYDMISSVNTQIDEIVDKIKDGLGKIKEIIEPFTPLLKTVGGFFLASFGFSWIKKLVTGSKSIKALGGIIGVVKAALTSTHSPLTGLNTGFTALSDKLGGLSTTMKAGIGVAGFAAEAYTAYNAVKEWRLGTMDMSEVLLNVIPVTVVVGTALSALCGGPIGLVITAIGLVVGAVAGWISADLELHRRLEETSFYAENSSTSITDLSDTYTNWSDSIVEANDKILENHAAIEQSQDNVKSLTGEIGDIKRQIELGVISAEEGFPKINELIEELHDGSADTLAKIQTNINLALSGSIGDALEKAGVSLPEYMSVVDKAVRGSNEALNKSQDKLVELTEKLKNLTVGSEEYKAVSQEMNEELIHMGELSGAAVDDGLSKLGESLIDLQEGLNFESPEAFKEAMGSIKTSVEDAKKSVTETYAAMIDENETLVRSSRAAGDEASAAAIEEYIVKLKETRDGRLSEIDSIMASTGDLIQNSFAQNMIRATEENAPSMWDKIRGVISGRSAESLQAERIGKDMAEPITEEFEKTFGTNMDSAVSNVTTGLMKGLTCDEVMSGLKDASVKLSDTIVNFFKKAQDINSPSRVMYELGAYSSKGVANGLVSDLGEIDLAAMKMSEAITTGFADEEAMVKMGTASSENIVNGLMSQIGSLDLAAIKMSETITTSFMDDISTLDTDVGGFLGDLKSKFTNWSATLKTPHLSWSTTSLPTGDWKYKILDALNLPTAIPKLNVSWYASGGVFDSPSIIGVGENGPEQVIPLADNAPWIEAVASKIQERSQMVERYSNNTEREESGGDWNIIIQKQDGTVEEEFKITAAERRNRRSGKTLIPV